MGGIAPPRRYRVPKRAIKGQTFTDFIVAHPEPENFPLGTDLSDEEVMTIEVQKRWEMYFDGVSKSPTGEQKGGYLKQQNRNQDSFCHPKQCDSALFCFCNVISPTTQQNMKQ